ncbi:MAG: RNA-binding protein [Alphaproteobacteria bacterium]|nr:RNA-binding protein [Alphaproteobacteria bacterium]
MPKKSEIMRECCLTRASKPASELIRFAVGPDNVLVPDVDARAPGRGVWVTLGEGAVAEAMRKKAFARGLKHTVEVPHDLAQLTGRRLEERLLGALGLARKAGQIVTGAAKVEAAIAARKAIALITASDAAEGGRDKMLAHLRSRMPQAGVGHFEFLSSGQLDLALGLENVIHAALVEGAAARAALARAERLARYRAGSGKEDGTI